MKGLAQNSKDKYGLSTYNNADGCFQYFKINKLTLHECSGKENKDRTLLIMSIFHGGELLHWWVFVKWLGKGCRPLPVKTVYSCKGAKIMILSSSSFFLFLCTFDQSLTIYYI